MINRMTFTVKEVAAILGLNPETIRRAYRDGKLKAAMLGHRKLVVSRTELERFWDAQGGGLFTNIFSTK